MHTWMISHSGWMRYDNRMGRHVSAGGAWRLAANGACAESLKVARMNAILKECDVERQPGLKMADKAALIVEKVPRDRLLNFLENPAEDAPAKKKSRTEPIVLPSGASTSLARYFHNTAASPDAEGQLETTLAANACPSLGDLYEKHVLSSGASASTTATCEPLSPISSMWSGRDLLEEHRSTAWWQKPSVGTWHSMQPVAGPQRRAKLKERIDEGATRTLAIPTQMPQGLDECFRKR